MLGALGTALFPSLTFPRRFLLWVSARFRALPDLKAFTKLQTLVLDKNKLSGKIRFPYECTHTTLFFPTQGLNLTLCCCCCCCCCCAANVFAAFVRLHQQKIEGAGNAVDEWKRGPECARQKSLSPARIAPRIECLADHVALLSQLSHLESLIKDLRNKFPNLHYLSCMKNPCEFPPSPRQQGRPAPFCHTGFADTCCQTTAHPCALC